MSIIKIIIIVKRLKLYNTIFLNILYNIINILLTFFKFQYFQLILIKMFKKTGN